MVRTLSTSPPDREDRLGVLPSGQVSWLPVHRLSAAFPSHKGQWHHVRTAPRIQLRVSAGLSPDFPFQPKGHPDGIIQFGRRPLYHGRVFVVTGASRGWGSSLAGFFAGRVIFPVHGRVGDNPVG